LDHGTRLPSIDVVRCCTRHRADSQQEQRQSLGHPNITWLVVMGVWEVTVFVVCVSLIWPCVMVNLSSSRRGYDELVK
jgi:hypothetical protein